MKTLPKLGLGTVQFGLKYGISNKEGQTPVTEVSAILNLCRLHQIILLDTASGYGEAELVLGENDLSAFKIVSKFLPEDTNGKIEMQLEKSLQLLKSEKLYGYIAHRPLDVLKKPAQWSALQELKRKGFIGKIGFSFNSPDEAEQVMNLGWKPDLVQVPYNYFDNRFEKYMKLLKTEGCEVHTRSTFLQGLFFVEQPGDYFAQVNDLIKELQSTFGASLPHALLKFVYDKDFIDRVVIGVETSAQLTHLLSFEETKAELPSLNINIAEEILTPSNWPNKN